MQHNSHSNSIILHANALRLQASALSIHIFKTVAVRNTAVTSAKYLSVSLDE